MIKVSFFTLGCRLNQSETAVLEGVFRDQGFMVVPFGRPADIAVINSCTVTSSGDSDARRAVRKAVSLNALVRVAVIGCQAQIQKEKILAWPNVNWVVGTAGKMRLAEIIGRDQSGGKSEQVVVPVIRRKAFTMPLSKVLAVHDAARTRANIKIQDGCDNFCAYCEIPFARGRSRSREFADVIKEAGALAGAGYKEVVITGVNVGDYSDAGKSLIDVVKGIEKFPGIERIRISSIEHTKLPLDLIGLMRPPHKLCRFLHIPVQSGCDRTLRRMGRAYSCSQVAQLVRQLTSEIPGLMLGTDVIVGFPGETAQDFEATRGFLESLPFHYFHVFSYSSRARARSRVFKNAVPDSVIKARSAILRSLSNAKHKLFVDSLLGTEQTVLFEQKKNEHWIGHTDNYVKIKVSSDKDLKNVLMPVILQSIAGGAVLATSKSRLVNDGYCRQDQRSYSGT
ncbi:MAG: tRNA (N(6)-L-threonylcarbamoyladenosine(37)-C(2))-methylthiotransferase MtaB [Candidatus Omnitrophica bacterium]|nr:tRNA (N(6)-L-threonylcarbamoyladenosine(37)-C(2))-methylthiotransferase MtaB [Candidatus Omnitrophota bacterium]